MMDGSFEVQRGMDQSILINCFTNEATTTALNVAGKTIRAFVRVSEGGAMLLDKATREVNGAAGIVALDLSPAESRLVPLGRKAQFELKLFDGTKQYIIARGILTGLGGISADI
jgi:hypothetical protein